MRVKRPARRAIIIGGSMSGLFSAAFLRQIGWRAEVYERSPVELVGRGAGITTHPDLLEALEKSGAGTRDLGIEVDKRIALDRDGRVIAEKYLPQILTSWDRLRRLMRGTLIGADGIRSSVREQVAPQVQPIYSGYYIWR